MPLVRNKFVNPANPTVDFYVWERNHSTEQPISKTRPMTHSAITSNVGLVRQQGEPEPVVIKLEGNIPTRAMHRQMWRWYHLCAGQTIYFTDHDNQQYEVQITHYEETRVANLTRPTRDPQSFHWTYVMEMEIFRFIAGDMHDMGIGA